MYRIKVSELEIHLAPLHKFNCINPNEKEIERTMKFKIALPLFLLLTLFTFNSCETKKSDDDTTTLLGLLLLSRQSSTVQTACGRTAGNSISATGKTSAIKGQTVTLSMENVSGEFKTVVIFTGVSNGDVITFATEASSFTYPASVDIEYSTGSSCPFSTTSSVASGLGLTLNSATADRLVYTASGTTPSSFSILMNVRQQSASNGRTITVNY